MKKKDNLFILFWEILFALWPQNQFMPILLNQQK